jgi:periplasmic protein TonB
MIAAMRPEPMASKQLMQGWMWSLVLHLGLVFLAVTMMPTVTIVLDQDPFKWEVSLVDISPQQETAREQLSAPVQTVHAAQTARAEPPPPDRAISEKPMLRVAPEQSARVVQPAVEPPTPQPIQPVQEAHPAPVKPTETPGIKKAEVREPEPVVKEAAKPEPVQEPVRAAAAEPAASRDTNQAPASADSRSVVEAHQESMAVASAPPPPLVEAAHTSPSSSPSVAEPKPSEEPLSPVGPSASATVSEPPTQVAKAAPQPHWHTPEAKADHRWVGESLWRRVAELKRYPSTARLNGLEGRVVLKAVIRADGHLAEVTVVKSSGHAVLDAAAMEAVKLACPLHMKHSIGPPQIVVSLPIVYSLAN